MTNSIADIAYAIVYCQEIVEPPLGIEPRTASLQVRCSTTELKGHFAGEVGLEPTTSGLTVRCSAN